MCKMDQEIIKICRCQKLKFIIINNIKMLRMMGKMRKVLEVNLYREFIKKL